VTRCGGNGSGLLGNSAWLACAITVVVTRDPSCGDQSTYTSDVRWAADGGRKCRP
jgi:hypothetical protein